VAKPFARRGGFPLVDHSAPAMNPLAQLILQLTCLGPAFDLAGADPFAPFAKGAGFNVASRPIPKVPNSN
jgi:hypothetical protein